MKHAPPICTYDYHKDTGATQDSINSNNDVSGNCIRVNGSDLSTSDITVNPGTEYPIQGSQFDQKLISNSPDYTCFSLGDTLANNPTRNTVFTSNDIVATQKQGSQLTNIQLHSEEKGTSHSVVNIENAIAEIQIPNVEETPRNCHDTCNSRKLDSSKARNTYSAFLEVVPGESCPDRSQNFAKLPEPIRSDENIISPHLPELNCSDVTDVVPGESCPDRSQNFAKLPEPIRSDENIISPHLPELNCSDDVTDVVPGESCPDRSQNFAKLPEPIRSDENIISPHLPELNCSDDVTDVVPGEPCPDRRQDADKLPEPIHSDENIIYPHLPELSCSDDVANSSYIPEPIRSDGNINSPHIADDISNSTGTQVFQVYQLTTILIFLRK